MRFLLVPLICLTLAAPAAAMPLDPLPTDVPQQDLRSPDTRDAALGRPVTSPTPAPAAEAEMPWALVGGGLAALALGGVAVRRARASQYLTQSR